MYIKNLSNGTIVYVEVVEEHIYDDYLVSKNLWAFSPQKYPASKVIDISKTHPNPTSDNVILSEDVAKIKQDAENAIRRGVKNIHEYRYFGGNSGYVGYSISRRGAEAKRIENEKTSRTRGRANPHTDI